MSTGRSRCIAGFLLLFGALWGCERAPDLVRKPSDPPSAILFEDVAVADVVQGRITGDRDVLVRGDRIERIAPAGQIDAPADAIRFEGRGRTLVPGYIDMHAHVGNGSAPSWVGGLPDPERNLQSYLYSGITTVMDPAGLSSEAFDLRDDVASGDLLGPRQFSAGPMITAVGGHPVPILERLAPWWLRWYLIPRFTKQVETPAEGREAAREIAGYGADIVKVAVDRIPESAPRLSPEVLKAVVREASSHDLRTVAHIGTLQDAIDAAEAGVAAWVHGVYKERLADEAVRKLAAYGIPMVATIAVFESYATLQDPPREPTRLEVETVDPEVLEAFNHIPEDDESIEFFREYLEKLVPLRPAWRDNVRRLHQAGVTILAGSDNQTGVFPGPGLHREFALLAEAGLSSAEVLRATTLYAARFLAQTTDPDFGIVAEGKRADLVLVEGDPLADVGALSRIRLVVQGGVPLSRFPVRKAAGKEMARVRAGGNLREVSR